MRITVVGSGTSGSLTSAFLKKEFPDSEVLMIHSDKVGTIGVGESITPHMPGIIASFSIDEKKFLRETGSVFKYGNSMEAWTDRDIVRNFWWSYDIEQEETWENCYNIRPNDTRSIDIWVDVVKNNLAPDLEIYHHNSPYYQYAKDLKMPFDNNGNYLLPCAGNYAYHIDAERTTPWIRNNICIPIGVIEKVATIIKVNVKNNNIENIILDNGEVIESDLWVDCSGLSRILISELTDEWISDEGNKVNSAWVCPIRYENKDNEFVNYTRSIARELGWQFSIALPDRIGTGLVYSDEYFSDEEALSYWKKIINNRQLREPRLLKWKPGYYRKPHVGNCYAVGMAAGFIDPLEANAVVSSIASMKRIAWMIQRNEDNEYYNKKMNYYFKDIAEFTSVHYTLSHRTDNKFWTDMYNVGKQGNHKELVKRKFYDVANCVDSNVGYVTAFPDSMWIDIANNWIRDFSDWPTKSNKEQQLKYIDLIRKGKLKHIEQAKDNMSIDKFYQMMYDHEKYNNNLKAWPLNFFQSMWSFNQAFSKKA